tara:strand:- start:351 stop:530 length:180 start_codon:yes stop_codon:yes gene_type:complete
MKATTKIGILEATFTCAYMLAGYCLATYTYLGFAFFLCGWWAYKNYTKYLLTFYYEFKP